MTELEPFIVDMLLVLPPGPVAIGFSIYAADSEQASLCAQMHAMMIVNAPVPPWEIARIAASC